MPKGRILAIDDERFFRKLYSDLLSQEGYQVVTAESGEEGIQVFAKEPFDIVITDMAMKGADGLQTTEAIKRINPRQDIVVVTVVDDVQLAVSAMKKGVADYLLKPINPDKFLHIIRTILDRQNLLKEHDKLISENLEYFGILSVYQRCLSILTVLDLDRLLDIALDSIMAETNAQGSILWLASPEKSDELKLATARGVVNMPSETDTLSVTAHSQEEMIRAGKPFYEKPGKGKGVNENTFYIPLKLGERVLGLVKVSDKLDRDRFEIRDLMIARTIGGFASIAIGNALEIKGMKSLGFKDPKTNTYNINYFADYITKEINKARRYQKTFSILYVKIENYSELKGEFDGSTLSEAVQGIIMAVTGVIRDTDILATAKSDEYYIFLPETDYFGSLMSIRRINKALIKKRFVSDTDKSSPLEVGICSVSFPKDGGDLKMLLDVVRRRVDERKGSPYNRYRLYEKDFWGMFDTLVGKGDDYPTSIKGGDVSMGGERKGVEDEEGVVRSVLLTHQILSQIYEVIFGEIEMSTDTRGIIYLGAKDMERFLALLGRHRKAETSATKIFLLGKKGDKGWELPTVTPVFVGEPAIENAQFLIFLSVDYAYAIFLRERKDGMYYGIHTSDPIFVENTIAKLQENYHLQVQL